MGERRWRRVRRLRKGDEEGADRRAAPSSRPGAERPTTAATEPLSLDGIVDLDASEDKQAAYAEWAERMKAKRAEKRDHLRALTEDADRSGGPSYWSAEAVWQESQRLEESGGAVASRVELLAVLGLGPGASDAEIVSSYRRLAKQHHPDRFPDADDATLARHVEQMQRLTAAYRALLPGRTS